MIATRSILNRRSPDDCPFCLRNGITPEEKVLKKVWWGYLVKEYSQNVPGTCQIVPIWHHMNKLKWLLFLWSFFQLVWKARPGSCNISINLGKEAGQTRDHFHIWIIPRYGIFVGKGHAFYVALDAKCRDKLGMSLEELVASRLPAED